MKQNLYDGLKKKMGQIERDEGSANLLHQEWTNLNIISKASPIKRATICQTMYVINKIKVQKSYHLKQQE